MARPKIYAVLIKMSGGLPDRIEIHETMNTLVPAAIGMAKSTDLRKFAWHDDESLEENLGRWNEKFNMTGDDIFMEKMTIIKPRKAAKRGKRK